MKKVFKIIGILLILAALGLAYYNYLENFRAGADADDIYAKLHEQIMLQAENEKETELSQTENGVGTENAETDALEEPATITLGEYEYMGEIEIPALYLKLPVISDWSYPKLKVAPCRYYGSIEGNDLILAAHNYDSHFGKLKNLELGEEINIVDITGQKYSYQISSMEVLEDTQLSDLVKEGSWDMTLFTCTKGGKMRVVVRCRMKRN